MSSAAVHVKVMKISLTNRKTTKVGELVNIFVLPDLWAWT